LVKELVALQQIKIVNHNAYDDRKLLHFVRKQKVVHYEIKPLWNPPIRKPRDTTNFALNMRPSKNILIYKEYSL